MVQPAESLLSKDPAWAQTYTQVDYPGACPGTTSLIGGPNPEGTSVGNYSDAATCRISHGFTLTAKGVFTTFGLVGLQNLIY